MLAWTAYDVVKMVSTDDPKIAGLRPGRFKAYGIQTKYWEAVEDLETDTYAEFKRGNSAGVDNDRLRQFGYKVDFLDNGDLSLGGDKIEYLRMWYKTKFIPVYNVFTNALVAVGNLNPNEQPKGTDISDELWPVLQKALADGFEKVNKGDIATIKLDKKSYDLWHSRKLLKEREEGLASSKYSNKDLTDGSSTEAISAGKDTTIRFVVDATMAEAIASSKTIELYRTTNEASPRYSQNHQVYSMIVKRASCTGNIAEFIGGGEDSNWNDAANWAGGNKPTNKDRVVITNNMTVDVTTAQAKEIILDQEAGGTLTINAGQALVVAGTIQKWNGSEFVPTTAADLAIGSSASGNGTLIFENDRNAATVEMYSIGSTDGWKWQYIGVPFDGANAQATYYGAYLYKWNNGWTAVQKSDELEEFAGYCISYPAANYTYVMDGALAPTTSQSINVPAGESMVVGNSWTAPIQITQLEDEDFSGLLKNVYLYNTGNDSAGTASTTNTPTGGAIYAAGTYISVPIHSAEYTDVKVISSLQGFFVKNNSGSAGTLSLSYSKHVRGGKSVVNGAMHAPKRVADEINRPAVLKMKVSGSQYDDRLILLEREDFTTGYDAGWDGDKMGDVATHDYS